MGETTAIYIIQGRHNDLTPWQSIEGWAQRCDAEVALQKLSNGFHVAYAEFQMIKRTEEIIVRADQIVVERA